MTSTQWETGGAALHEQAEEEGPDRSALRSATPGGVSTMVKGGAPSSLGSSVGIGDRRRKGSLAGAARSTCGGREPTCGEEQCPGSNARQSGALGDACAMVEGGVPCSLGGGDGTGDSAVGTGDGGDAVGSARVEVVPERGDGGHQRTAGPPKPKTVTTLPEEAEKSSCREAAKVERRKKVKREGMRRSRQSSHYKKHGDLEQPRKARWVSSIPKDPHEKPKEIKRLTQKCWSGCCDFDEGKVRERDLKLTTGVIISSASTTVSLYAVRGSVLVGAMIVAPAKKKGQDWEAIEHGRLLRDRPVPKMVRSEHVDQISVGSALSSNCTPCVLVKNSAGDMAWVRESEVGPVEQDGKRRTAPPDRFEPGVSSVAPSVPQLRSRGGILKAVEASEMELLYEHVKMSAGADSVIVDPQSATEKVMHLFRSSKASSNKDLKAASEAITLSVWFDAVCSDKHVRVAVVDEAFDTQPPLPLNVVARIIESCQPSSSGLERESGLKSDKHRSSQNSKAESGQKRSGRKDQHDQKKTKRVYKNCVNCDVNRSKRAGSLCEFCFLVNGGMLDKTLCRVCGEHGYGRVAHKQGGRCSVCVQAKAGKAPKPKCVSCQWRIAHYKGNLCWTCSNQQKHGDTP